MSAPLLLLILFDGLGHKLFQEHVHSFGNLSKFYGNSPKIKEGVTMVFPTTTGPNLMSIATGLYPESHGISNNNMKAYGSEIFKYNFTEFHVLTKTDEDVTWWDNGLNMPIWTLNELSSSASDPRYSGGMFWPGSGVAYQKKNIEYYQPYEQRISWYKEIDAVMEWFMDEEMPANCVFLYFDDPDLALHNFGTKSEEFLDAMREVDDIVGYLMNMIDENNLTDSLNVIITADHGMVDVPVDHYNEIKKLNISDDSFEVIENGVSWNIYPYPGAFYSVYNSFYRGSSLMNYSVWMREEFPENAHFKYGLHVAPVILLSDPGYFTVFEKPENISMVGGHGYNNTLPSMNAVFLAQGPAFNSAGQVNSIKSVDLYPLMCAVLMMTPYPNNGSLALVAPLLNYLHVKQDPNNSGSGTSIDVIVVAVMFCVIGLIVLLALAHWFYKKYIISKNLANRFNTFTDANPLDCFDDDL